MRNDQLSLFGEDKSGSPLAERMRPCGLEEFCGQEHLLGPGRLLRVAIERGDAFSMIFWGPPGTGKTTLAFIIAKRTSCRFIPFSAVTSGIKEIKAVMEEAESEWRTRQRRSMLFIDEIHRFNKAQQDAFLPYVERGHIVLVGATTENPSFEINSALLSRVKVLVLNPLAEADVRRIVERALESEKGLGPMELRLEPPALDSIVAFANGDARVALNAIELAAGLVADRDRLITIDMVKTALQKKTLLYDKAGEEHYNLISALHKSLRNSDPQAALYWLVRMVEGGEDPLYIARRMVRFAVEDVGLADPRALDVSLAARDAFHFLGQPEGNLALAQAAIYLASCPKSNSIYKAYDAVTADLEGAIADPAPLQIRNAPTRLMDELGYGEGYKYAHEAAERITDLQCLPDRLRDRIYWTPIKTGFEKTVAQRFEEWERLKRQYRERKE
ncbi:MAG: replication-associated recombination protein A [Acidobacteriota bacterium]